MTLTDAPRRACPMMSSSRPATDCIGPVAPAQVGGIDAGFVLADAGYGNDTDFRDGITEIGLAYAVGIQSSTTLWPPGAEPLPPKPWSGRGRPTSAIQRDAEHQPVSAKKLALALPRKAWRRVTWR